MIRVNLGGWGNKNIKTLYPEIYQKLTTENFAINAYSISGSFHDYHYNGTNSMSLSYNANTGILTCNGSTSVNWADQMGSCSASVSVSIYMYYLN